MHWFNHWIPSATKEIGVSRRFRGERGAAGHRPPMIGSPYSAARVRYYAFIAS